MPDPPSDSITIAEEAKLPPGPVTQRIVAEVQTSPPGCAGCHTLLNPLGFSTENFDSLGRERTLEKVFNEAGKLLGELPVDTRIAPQVDERDTAVVDGAAGVTASLVRSRRVEACFASQMVRFAFGKKEEDTRADGCLLARLEATARRGGTLRELLLALVESPEFKQRRVDR